MINWKIENHRGDILKHDGVEDFVVTKITGLNPPGANINTSANTTTDGSKINSVRLGNRNIVIYITINNDVEKTRIRLYQYFAVKKKLRLFFKNGTRNVFIDGYVEKVECDLFTKKQDMQISIVCNNPYFKSLEEIACVFSDTQAGFEFPFDIQKEGIEFSTIIPSQRKSVMNEGEAETGLTIEIYARGTVINPILYDVGKRTNMKINFTMKASDKIVINTSVGEKSIILIRGGVSSNAMGYLDNGSSWLNIEPGENIFTYHSDEGNGNMEITFKTPLLYGGI